MQVSILDLSKTLCNTRNLQHIYKFTVMGLVTAMSLN